MGKNLEGRDLGKGYSQRKDGRYEARAVVNGYKIDLYNVSLKQLKKDFDTQKAKVINKECNNSKGIELKDWYEEWFSTCKSPQLKSVASRMAYNRKARNTYLKLLGDKKLENVSQMDIQNASNELSSDYSERYIRESLGILRECFDIAIVNHIITINPCICINVKADNRQREKRVLEHWEQDLFLNEVKGNYYEEAYYVLLLTGMRIGEFSGLQWSDIDFVKKEINIKRSLSTSYINGVKTQELSTPKTFNAYRTIPFLGEVEKYLVSWKHKQDEYKKELKDKWRCDAELGNLVFTSTLGSPVTRYVIVHDIKRTTDNINFKEIQNAISEGRQPKFFNHIYPHAFRHTFATRCFEKKLDPLFIQTIMGHANYSTTVSYTHILDNININNISKAKNLLNI